MNFTENLLDANDLFKWRPKRFPKFFRKFISCIFRKPFASVNISCGNIPNTFLLDGAKFLRILKTVL